MAYELEEEAANAAFAKFKNLADRKKAVSDEDIRALLEEKLIDTPEVFTLETIQVSCGNKSTPKATVSVRVGGEIREESAEGNGSVDASYNAIDLATKVELEDYSIKSVSQGKDALGEVTWC